MAMLGWSDYRCEACKFFDTDGADGNHPSCSKQRLSFKESSRAIKVDEDCPFGYEFGIPKGYPVSMERNKKRAYEVNKILLENKIRKENKPMFTDGDILYIVSCDGMEDEILESLDDFTKAFDLEDGQRYHVNKYERCTNDRYSTLRWHCVDSFEVYGG